MFRTLIKSNDCKTDEKKKLPIDLETYDFGYDSIGSFYLKSDNILRMDIKGSIVAFVIQNNQNKTLELWIFKNSEIPRIFKIHNLFGKIKFYYKSSFK